MTDRHSFRALALAALLTSGPLQAADAPEGLSTGIVGGTLGAGIQLSYEIHPNLNLRAQYTKWDLSTTKTVDDIDYDIDATVGAVGLYADYYPFGNGFHLSVGLTRNLTELKVKNQRFTRTFDIGSTSITGTAEASALTGKATFDAAPYVGIGWGQRRPKGWGVRMDLGAHFLGKPDVKLNVDTGKITPATTISDADIRLEERKARDDIGSVIYPELSLTLIYGW